MDTVKVWRGGYGDATPPFGPLPGKRTGNALVYEWQLPDAFVPWPGRSQLERAYVLLDVGVQLCDPLWMEVTLPDGRRAEGVGSVHGDAHTWYIDLVDVEQVDGAYFVRDLYVDLVVPMDGRAYKTLDLDEFGDAIEAGLVPTDVAVDGLRRWQRFLDGYIHSEREAGRAWSDFPPAVIQPLQQLAEPLRPVVAWEF